MQLKEVKRLAEQAGIGLDGVKVKIIRDPEMIRLPHAGWANPNGKEIQLYPNAFINEEQLVKTLAHERTHIFQVRIYGEAKDIPMLDKFEEGAYGIENTFWDYFLIERADEDGKSSIQKMASPCRNGQRSSS